MGVLAGRWVDEDLGLLSPSNHGVMVRLVVEEVAYASIVTCTPEQVDGSEDGNSGGSRQ